MAHIEGQFGDEGPCECCGRDPAECICPECPICGEQGNPECYRKKVSITDEGRVLEGKGHGLEYNREQRIGQSKMRIAALKEQIQDEEMFLAYMEEHPEEDPT
jgi:hypothetical protein